MSTKINLRDLLENVKVSKSTLLNSSNMRGRKCAYWGGIPVGNIFLISHIISRIPQEELIVPSANPESSFLIPPSKLLSGWLEQVIYVIHQIKCVANVLLYFCIPNIEVPTHGSSFVNIYWLNFPHWFIKPKIEICIYYFPCD